MKIFLLASDLHMIDIIAFVAALIVTLSITAILWHLINRKTKNS